ESEKKKRDHFSLNSDTASLKSPLIPPLSLLYIYFFALAPGCCRRCCFAFAPGTWAAADVFTSSFRAFAIAWLGFALAFFGAFACSLRFAKPRDTERSLRQLPLFTFHPFSFIPCSSCFGSARMILE
ncbi:MAG: hypothetical protein OIF58_09050, partial [Cohaesibacter sp.]|nr:hypothetical protein [Cohaesibacter sp.]